MNCGWGRLWPTDVVECVVTASCKGIAKSGAAASNWSLRRAWASAKAARPTSAEPALSPCGSAWGPSTAWRGRRLTSIVHCGVLATLRMSITFLSRLSASAARSMHGCPSPWMSVAMDAQSRYVLGVYRRDGVCGPIAGSSAPNQVCMTALCVLQASSKPARHSKTAQAAVPGKAARS